MSETGPVPAVVLAGGTASPEFAAASGVSKRCLVRFRGRTLLEIVCEALRGSGLADPIFVVGDVPAPAYAAGLAEGGGFVENLFLGLEACGSAEHALVATSDMPFVTPDAVARFVEGARTLGADLVYPIVPVDACRTAYPGMRRTSLALVEGRFTGGNMVLIRRATFLRQRGYIEAAYAQRKRPLRLAMMLGPGVTLAVALSMATGRGFVRLARLERAASRLLRAEARALITRDASLAADVDRPGDLRALAELERMPEDGTSATS